MSKYPLFVHITDESHAQIERLRRDIAKDKGLPVGKGTLIDLAIAALAEKWPERKTRRRPSHE